MSKRLKKKEQKEKLDSIVESVRRTTEKEHGKFIREINITGETSNNISYECGCFLKEYDGVPKLRIYCHFPQSAPLYDFKNVEQFKHKKYKLLNIWKPDVYIYDPDKDNIFQRRFPAVDDFEFISDIDPQKYNLESKKVKNTIKEKVREEVLEAIDFFAKDNPVIFTVLSDRVMVKESEIGHSLDLKEIKKRIKRIKKDTF